MSTLNLTEYPDLELCKSIWRHPDMKEEHRARIKSYCDEAIKNGCVQVSYETKFGFGRLYPTNPYLTATTMKGRTRATIFGLTEEDIDIINCHACVLLDIIEHVQPDLDTPALRKYVNKRDEIINDFLIHRKCPYYCAKEKKTITKKDLVKSLFNIILYGGTIKTWVKTWDLKETEFQITEFVEEFQAEMQQITSLVVNHKQMKSVKSNFLRYKFEKKTEGVG